MIFRQVWMGRREGEQEWFPASVPGNIQKDYADWKGWGDLNYGENCRQYAELEDDSWRYRTSLNYSAVKGEQVWFVSGGVDYRFDLTLNGKRLVSHEGMFTPVELELTGLLDKPVNMLEIIIYPHPKRQGAPVGREEADACCKPPVSYGWDWHPRVIPSGIWNDAYLETRKSDQYFTCEPFYTLSEDFQSASVQFETTGEGRPVFEFYSAEGEQLYCGTEPVFTLVRPRLWWCNGQGEPYLYRWSARTESCERSGTIGFRSVELVMNGGTWEEPDSFPKTRSVPPMTVKLNGRRIFAKGTNWVNPEIFTGTATQATYEPLVRLAHEANMNLFRCWGGAGCNKKEFYELCDQYGILVWQEFPLACNNYTDTQPYLKVLEQEARSIVRSLRQHPSVALWCGGNELFNNWSGMTDQSHALRLLNKICYEEDRLTPFLPTSPVMGAAHGCYLFRFDGMEVYQLMNQSHSTAYLEFGVPGMPDAEYLRTFIPGNELFPPKPGTSWELHHGFSAWQGDSWICLELLKSYFGEINNLDQLCQYSSWLQSEGYKAIFEEARRQYPYCSMALNWCYNEPWKTAANNSLISYPARPKLAYYAVRDSLRPVLPSARLDRFAYRGGELFSCELWLLNDSLESVSDTISVSIVIGDLTLPLLEWKTGETGISQNLRGHRVQATLPVCVADRFELVLGSVKYGESRYMLRYLPQEVSERSKLLNL